MKTKSIVITLGTLVAVGAGLFIAKKFRKSGDKEETVIDEEAGTTETLRGR